MNESRLVGWPLRAWTGLRFSCFVLTTTGAREERRGESGGKIPAIMRTVSEAMKHRAISWLAELFGGRANSAGNENRQRTGRNSQRQQRLPTCSVMTFGTPFHTEKSQFVGDNPTRYVLFLPFFILHGFVPCRYKPVFRNIYMWISRRLYWYATWWIDNENLTGFYDILMSFFLQNGSLQWKFFRVQGFCINLILSCFKMKFQKVLRYWYTTCLIDKENLGGFYDIFRSFFL